MDGFSFWGPQPPRTAQAQPDKQQPANYPQPPHITAAPPQPLPRFVSAPGKPRPFRRQKEALGMETPLMRRW